MMGGEEIVCVERISQRARSSVGAEELEVLVPRWAFPARVMQQSCLGEAQESSEATFG